MVDHEYVLKADQKETGCRRENKACITAGDGVVLSPVSIYSLAYGGCVCEGISTKGAGGGTGGHSYWIDDNI